MMRDLALEAVDQLLLGKASLFEEPFHERVVALGDLLDQLLTPAGRFTLQARRDVAKLEFTGAIRSIEISSHRYEVDHATEILLFPDGDLDGDDVLAELFLHRFECAR